MENDPFIIHLIIDIINDPFIIIYSRFYSWSTRKNYKNPKKNKKKKNTWTLPGLTFQPPLVFQQSRWRVDRSDSCHGTRGIPTSVARWSLTVSKEVSKNIQKSKNMISKLTSPKYLSPKNPAKDPPGRPRSPQHSSTTVVGCLRPGQGNGPGTSRDLAESKVGNLPRQGGF